MSGLIMDKIKCHKNMVKKILGKQNKLDKIYF